MNTQSIDWPLCNKLLYIGQDRLEFFLSNSVYSGDYSKDNRLSPYISNDCKYTIREFIFFVSGKSADDKILNHMIDYGYFIFRILDRDYLILPCMCMEKGKRTLSFKLNIPIVLEPNMNYIVILSFSKKLKYICNIMCMLLGEATRRAI